MRYIISLILCLWASCSWAFGPGFFAAVTSGGNSGTPPVNLIPTSAVSDVTDPFWSHVSGVVKVDSDTVSLTTTNGYFYGNDITVSPSTGYTLSFSNPSCTAVNPSVAIYDVSNSSWILLVNTVILPCSGVFTRNFITPAGCNLIRIYPVRACKSIGTVDIHNISVTQQ